MLKIIVKNSLTLSKKKKIFWKQILKLAKINCQFCSSFVLSFSYSLLFLTINYSSRRGKAKGVSLFSKERKSLFSFFATQQLVIMPLALAQTCFELQMKAMNKPITTIIGCQTCYNSNNDRYEKKILIVALLLLYLWFRPDQWFSTFCSWWSPKLNKTYSA